MLFENLENRFDKVGLGSQFKMIAGILGYLRKESIQQSRKLINGMPVILGVVFLLEDESPEARDLECEQPGCKTAS